MRLVVKLGGSILEPVPAASLIEALARAAANGHQVVIVHGGGKALSALLRRLGIETRFVRGLRVTDTETLRAAVMALAGEVNTTLVGALNRAGVRAVGLTGLDGACVRARVDRPELGAVGAVSACAPELWLGLLATGFVPTLASIASDGAGGVLNVNADQFAAACAAALGADALVFTTDVPGILGGDGVLPRVTLAELDAMTATGGLHGGMLPKADACRMALAAGVARVIVVGEAGLEQLDEMIDGEMFAGTEVLQ
ncbi:MAG TPA: acetylglutamate kinase [Terriglobales bacterium]|nr:acetylglutamate kinase [Terriglobales bacterium]